MHRANAGGAIDRDCEILDRRRELGNFHWDAREVGLLAGIGDAPFDKVDHDSFAK